ncbi:phosphoglycerate mutase [Cordyceps fumosorosea ARSEF 2679]|uniref:Phosphoglycerate mutase n=1 Tax=Cordyceps fumosorosea (strain ARSEF 2679) TaxID=1081104 RepID=A0A167U8C5_CORFA|nr:phosphoglycerate mutase [Cordyceps fumosorosea ARSEF 2679]OAA61330.1 phosphoglycerate mutase [Cordyceps fumosorosea ARSEF 2679]
MVAPPSHIFVVRHGNRLDAADKKWHLTSPTPYDPPLTFSGLQQARQVGNYIGGILEQAKLEHEVKNEAKPGFKRRRFRIVIHTSPFLRCVQTSVGISSGLAQLPAESMYKPSDIIVPPHAAKGQTNKLKTAVLRIDSFLGEWLSPEYFEMITPPPGPALMLGGAKAELLRREDYSFYSFDEPPPPPPPTQKLWQSPKLRPIDAPQSPAEDNGSPILGVASLASALPSTTTPKKGYVPPRPSPPVPGAGSIPEGIVAHARDTCVSVDFQWDSMREPLDFGDGGQLGEEWISMHKRFRKGLRKMVNWYANTDNAAEMVTTMNSDGDHTLDATDDEEIETVLVLVSHGAGCNALMGAITHQPVLMDVSIASITMAQRRPLVDYERLRDELTKEAEAQSLVAVDDLYEIRTSATTEHLHSTASTPSSARSASANNAWNPHARGRTSTFSNGSGAVISPFTYNSDAFPMADAPTASAAVEKMARRESSQKSIRSAFNGAGNIIAARSKSTRSNSSSSSLNNEVKAGRPPSSNSNSTGLWAPAPSSLRLMDDNLDEDSNPFDAVLPNFGSFSAAPPPAAAEEKKLSMFASDFPSFPSYSTSSGGPVHAPSPFGNFGAVDSPGSVTPGTPMFAGPIKLQTSLDNNDVIGPPEEVIATPLGGGLGGLWGRPTPPSDADKFRDMSHTKRRWTVNERPL